MTKEVIWLLVLVIVVVAVLGFSQNKLGIIPKNGGIKGFSLFPEIPNLAPSDGIAPSSETPSQLPETSTEPNQNAGTKTPALGETPKNYIAPPKTQTPSSGNSQPTTQPTQEKSPKLSLNFGQATSDKPQTEYVEIANYDYNSKQNAVISGLTLKNRDNISATIGKDSNGNNIALAYSERAYIVTGTSPNGTNFKANKCSGYFNQSYSFSPSLSYSCPSIYELALPRSLNNNCVNYIQGLPSCTAPNFNADTGINAACVDFVAQHASYSGCVSDHQKDSDFDQHEWRIYLEKSAEIWNNRHDLIQLLDQAGKLITETSY